MPAGYRYLAALLCLAAAGGCASGPCAAAPDGPTCDNCLFECRAAEAQVLVPDVTAVGEAVFPDPPSYCALAEQDVPCLAARHSLLGNLLANESGAMAMAAGGSPDCPCPALADVIRLSALHQRNEDAARALELFLRLVAAEAGARSLDLSVTEFDGMMDQIQRLESEGLVSPVSKFETEQRQLDVQYRRVELGSTIGQLNGQLAGMLNVDLPAGARFWPECNLSVSPEVPPAEDAVIAALVTRADLAAARLACRACAQEDRAGADWLLRQLSGGLAPPRESVGWLLPGRRLRGTPESPACDQLALLVAQRERAVRQETLQAVSDVAARLNQVDLRRKKLGLARQRLASLEQQQDLNPAAAFPRRTARLEVITVEQELLQEVVEWKLAVVRLLRAQGFLALQCAYAP